jgi:glutamate synthase (NADPH/NADH) small chain
MGKSDAFITIPRRNFAKQDARERLRHHREIYLEMAEEDLLKQAARCMDCGVPYCHSFGCPLGNVIPEWNHLIYLGRWREANELLHLTNNFPEITGRICPALCEAACTLGLTDDSVTVRQNEYSIVERAWKEGWIKPMPPESETGKKVAVIGSGPAGMAASQQLRRAGHKVTLFDRSDRLGGILRFGIPDYKLEKRILDRRLEQMAAEGVVFETDICVGRDISATYLLKRFDAICLCVGSGVPRDLTAENRELSGIHFAMDFLIQQNRRNAGLPIDGPEILAKDKRVVIIGGGDTGADCLGTALRQGARSVHQLEIMPRPPMERDPATPWPQWPNMLRTSTAHEEGGERRWSVATTAFIGDQGRVTGLRGHEVKWTRGDDGRMNMTPLDGTDFEMEADLVLLAMGFVHPQRTGLLDDLEIKYDGRGNIQVDDNMATSVPGVFSAGDATTGAWLVVRAIAAGRRMAHCVDNYLMGETCLPDCPPLPR